MNPNKGIKIIRGGVTAPEGFLAAGINCGLRKNRPDLGLIYSKTPCLAAGAFTKNRVKAAPVLFSMKNIKNPVHAIVVNSRVANACTGRRGAEDTLRTARIASRLLGTGVRNILIASTGVIGKFLDMKKISSGLKLLAGKLSRRGNEGVAQAMLTTDTVKKETAIELMVKGRKVRIGGIAKGSGMIGPDMATLLAFITTDVLIDKTLMKKVFAEGVKRSFNAITIDGDMSTNDTALMLANGRAGNSLLGPGDAKDLALFSRALHYVLDDLARKLVMDGEGATRFVRISVSGCAREDEARAIAFKIARSPLVKTAFYGSDANWGRILASAGSAGVAFDPERAVIRFGPTTLYKNGEPAAFSESLLKKYLSQKEIAVSLDLGQGKGSFTVLTTDLTEDYIRINAHYRS